MKCELDQLTVHYDIYGNGQPLLFLSGWTASSAAMAHVYEPLFADADAWQRIYVDLPGHGHTPGSEAIRSLDDFLTILLGFVDKVIGGRPFALAGLSLGGYLTRGVLLHRFGQVNGLLLVAPAIVTEDARRDVPKPTVVVRDPEAMMQLTAEEADVMALFTVQNAATVGEMRAFGTIMAAAGDAAFQERIRTDPAAYRFSFDVDALLPVFPRPTLIITGRQDFVVGYRDAWGILEQYPRATFVVFDRAGHMLEQKSAEMRPLITEWLARVTEYAIKKHHE
ncbi:MAG: alpha/beta hydrolase [Anaerolineae bacterium]|nr:alpha/beta hydrolase [Anaerolineae bacterium]